MLVKVTDEFYIASHKVTKVTCSYERSSVSIFTDDGQEHVVKVSVNFGVFNRFDEVIKTINKAFE